MKNGVMIVNTSRGALIDSQAAIEALKNQKIGSLGMDVYENERDLFFEDKSNDVIRDDVFRRLSACHNVLFTGHRAFLTAEALTSISQTTLQNLSNLEKAKPARTNWFNLAAPLHSGELIQIIPKDLSSSILKIVLNQKQ